MSFNAVVITTHYSDSVKHHDKWNQETNLDLKTIKEVFPEALELIIPAGKLSHKLIRQNFQKINELVAHLVRTRETQIPVILNTHGTPGSHDIDNDIILKLVETLSYKNIKITALYALLCNGFYELTSQEIRFRNPMLGVDRLLRDKPSSMKMLQAQLRRLTTKIPQIFDIHGFIKAYDPAVDQDEVFQMLRGVRSEASIKVMTNQIRPLNHREILDQIKIIKRYGADAQEATVLPSDESKQQYETAGNKIAILLYDIAENIRDCIIHRTTLKEADSIIYHAIMPSQVEDETNIPQSTLQDFNLAYKNWMRKNKLRSDDRLTLLTAHLKAIGECDRDVDFSEGARPRSHSSRFFTIDNQALAGQGLDSRASISPTL